MTASIEGTLQAFDQDKLVFLYELDVTPLGGPLLRFHDGTNQRHQSVVWAGNEYLPYPIQGSGFDYDPQQPSAPKLTVANVTSTVSALLRNYEELAQVKVTRLATKAKYLDAVNFGLANMLYWSEDLSQSAWTLTGATVAAAGTQEVDGDSYNGSWLTAEATGGVSVRRGEQVVDLTQLPNMQGSPVTLAVLALAEPGAAIPSLAMTLLSSNGGAPTPVMSVQYDLLQGLNSDGAMRSLGGGYYLCSFSVIVPTDATSLSVRLDLADADGNTALPAGASGRLQLTAVRLSGGTAADVYKRTTSSWNPDADPTQELLREVYCVARKKLENPVQVVFELAPATDLHNLMLPKDQVMQNSCRFQYRRDGCGYAGGPVADVFDNSTNDPTLDNCSRTLQGCKLRPRSNGVYPFGGFPGVGRAQGY